MSQYSYLSAEQLSHRIPYCRRYITEVLKDRVLIEGTHYLRPFNDRGVVYLWEPIEELMLTQGAAAAPGGGKGIPLTAGGVCNG